ncbi:hypothetical protein R5R35_005506 [Gryllus longicercus]
MNRGLALALALAALVAVALAAPAEEKYTDKYDNVNLDEILSNERLFKKYLECLLADTDVHCTADGKELKKSIPDALTNDCAKCTNFQKNGSGKVIKHLRENKPADWQRLQAKYDPEDVYMTKFAENRKASS